MRWDVEIIANAEKDLSTVDWVGGTEHITEASFQSSGLFAFGGAQYSKIFVLIGCLSPKNDLIFPCILLPVEIELWLFSVWIESKYAEMSSVDVEWFIFS